MDAAEDNPPAMLLTMMKQSTMPMTAHNAMTEKTKTCETPTTASTFHQPQQLLKVTNDNEDIIGDDFQMPPLTMMPTEQTPTNTKTTKKTLIVDFPPSTKHY